VVENDDGDAAVTLRAVALVSHTTQMQTPPFLLPFASTQSHAHTHTLTLALTLAHAHVVTGGCGEVAATHTVCLSRSITQHHTASHNVKSLS
jgi:hypothetical protein